MKRISFVVPVYRNERPITYQQICQVCQSNMTAYAYEEIVFMDDGIRRRLARGTARDPREGNPNVRVTSSPGTSARSGPPRAWSRPPATSDPKLSANLEPESRSFPR